MIAPSLTFIYNNTFLIFLISLSSRIFVDEWKNARVYSVYKDNDRRDLGSYRSISILPIIIPNLSEFTTLVYMRKPKSLPLVFSQMLFPIISSLTYFGSQ